MFPRVRMRTSITTQRVGLGVSSTRTRTSLRRSTCCCSVPETGAKACPLLTTHAPGPALHCPRDSTTMTHSCAPAVGAAPPMVLLPRLLLLQLAKPRTSAALRRYPSALTRHQTPPLLLLVSASEAMVAPSGPRWCSTTCFGLAAAPEGDSLSHCPVILLRAYAPPAASTAGTPRRARPLTPPPTWSFSRVAVL